MEAASMLCSRVTAVRLAVRGKDRRRSSAAGLFIDKRERPAGRRIVFDKKRQEYRRENFSGDNSGGSNTDRRCAAAFSDQEKREYDKGNTGRLLYQLGDGRNFGFLKPERIAADTAVDSGTR